MCSGHVLGLHLVQGHVLEGAVLGEEHPHAACHHFGRQGRGLRVEDRHATCNHPPPRVPRNGNLGLTKAVGGQNADLLYVLQSSFAFAKLLVVAEAHPRHKAPVEKALEDGGDIEPPRRVDQDEAVAPPQTVDSMLDVGVLFRITKCAERLTSLLICFGWSAPVLGQQVSIEALCTDIRTLLSWGWLFSRK